MDTQLTQLTTTDQYEAIREILLDCRYPAMPSTPGGTRAIAARAALFDALAAYEREVLAPQAAAGGPVYGALGESPR